MSEAPIVTRGGVVVRLTVPEDRVPRVGCLYDIRESCRLCEARLPGEHVLDLGETALANELKSTREESLAQDTFPLYLVRCENCGAVQLPVIVPPERLFPDDYPYESGTTETFREHLRQYAVWLSDQLRKPSRVLEIGSNDGTFLRYMKDLGHTVVGVDPAAHIAAVARESGVPTEIAHFGYSVALRIAVTYGPFDAVVANNVLAHVDDLAGVVEGVAHVLRPGGLFVFEVGYLPRVCERGLLGTVYHEHVHYHAVRPLRQFLRDRDLTISFASASDSQGGSVRVHAVKGAVSYPVSPGLYERPDLSLLDRARRRLQEKAVAVIEACLQGKRVCGYGAPAKLTTLLAASGLDADSLECVFDDNPRKVGKFTPGTGIPIVASAELAERKPDVLVLFSSNFEREIRAKHPEFTGEWVVF